jgi:hypothetical protein
MVICIGWRNNVYVLRTSKRPYIKKHPQTWLSISKTPLKGGPWSKV